MVTSRSVPQQTEQMLSARADLLPEAYIFELRTLTEHVPPVQSSRPMHARPQEPQLVRSVGVSTQRSPQAKAFR